jgi:integrase
VKTSPPGRYFDGDGLVLLVRKAKQQPQGTAGKQPDRAFWLFRYSIGGRIREAGLGRARGHNAVSLAEARERARRLRDRRREGKDPLSEREAEAAKAEADAAKAKAAAITFAHVADMYVAAHEQSWRNLRHREQWRSTLRDYALPAIADLPVGSVDTGAVVKIIEPLWREKTETASRLRGRIERILDYAKARGWRGGENPARWRGHLDQLLPKRGKMRHVVHHAALPWHEIGAFMQRLRQGSSLGARCLEFLILTACRSGEVRGARWSEIDLERAVWIIPEERMKAGREHRVPLSEPAIDVLRTMAQLGTDGFVFPGLKTAAPLSDRALARLCRGCTVHGMRSTFRDWCAETTNYPRELAEAALAHTLKDKVEAAYQRGDFLEKRRRLMTDWATFCTTARAQDRQTDVTHLRAS